MQPMRVKLFDRELKKGSAELLILSLIEHRPRHGYEISKLIEQRSDGVLKFNVGVVLPLAVSAGKAGIHFGAVGGEGGASAGGATTS